MKVENVHSRFVDVYKTNLGMDDFLFWKSEHAFLFCFWLVCWHKYVMMRLKGNFGCFKGTVGTVAVNMIDCMDHIKTKHSCCDFDSSLLTSMVILSIHSAHLLLLLTCPLWHVNQSCHVCVCVVIGSSLISWLQSVPVENQMSCHRGAVHVQCWWPHPRHEDNCIFSHTPTTTHDTQQAQTTRKNWVFLHWQTTPPPPTTPQSTLNPPSRVLSLWLPSALSSVGCIHKHAYPSSVKPVIRNGVACPAMRTSWLECNLQSGVHTRTHASRDRESINQSEREREKEWHREKNMC